ncbi:MAG: M48 family metalloprotease [Roseateles sp.]
MNRHEFGDTGESWSRHRWLNRLQTALLVVTLLGIAAMAGSLLFGDMGLWLALAAGGLALLLEPAAASSLTLRLYRARALHPSEAPDLWALVRELASRAGLPAVPVPHYAPSAMVNAFATGSAHRSAIVLTDGLLRSLTPRECLLPGWGNPEPSWLRTHPATAARIERWRELSAPVDPTPIHSPHFLPDSTVSPSSPRWRPGGLWR